MRTFIRPPRPLVFVLCATAALGTASQPKKLVFAPPVGKKYSYSLVTDFKSAGVGPMASMSMTQSVGMVAQVLSKTAQGTKVRLKFVSSKTTTPPNSPLASMVANMDKMFVGAQVDAVYDSRAKQIGESTSTNPAIKQAMGGALQAGFLGIEFPSGPVAPGTTWKSNLDISKVSGRMPGMVQFGKNSTLPIAYRLTKFLSRGGKNLAAIETTIKGKVDMTMNMGQSQPGAKPMKMTIAMDMKANALVDMATGLPTSEETKGTMTTQIQGMNVLQNLSSVLKMK